MEIVCLLNVHDHPKMVMDTIESIKTWVTDDILVICDKAGTDKFAKVDWGNCVFKEGFWHRCSKATYRNITLGLKLIYETFPDKDWYCYTEYDCLFVSDRFKEDLRSGPFILANDIRFHENYLPYLQNIVGFNVSRGAIMLGCCVFYSGEFIKKLYNLNFFDKLLEATEQLPIGTFPDYRHYAFEECLFPTLALSLGGTIEELGAWRHNGFTNGKYLMRFSPPINREEITLDASILHPLKNPECPIRSFYTMSRAKYLKWLKN